MKKTSLIILDGFGLNKQKNFNAIALAKTPNFDKLFESFNYSSLDASGEAVGVLEGQIGNSEVGHMTIGSGRIAKQAILEIDELFKSSSFEKNKSFKDGLAHINKNNSKLHIMGLLGPGGVHAHSKHIKEIIKLIPRNISVYLHIFGDGRDTNYKSLLSNLKHCLQFLDNYENVKIASISGRYFAMDRDNNWDRTKKAYDAIVLAKPYSDLDILDYIKKSYDSGVYDEFIEPVCFDKQGIIDDNDTVFFMNFRSDRARQITQAIIIGQNVDKNTFSKDIKNLYFATMTKYYEDYNKNVFIERKYLKNTLSEIFSDLQIKHLHLAETEKFAHVTKFFNGGNNIAFPYQENILVPSPKVKTYDLKPEMSAYRILGIYKKEMLNFGFCVVNFANGDMVGHSGDLEASIKAVEILDDIIGELIKFCTKNNIELLITADHGNCEEMGDEQKPHTAHTLNPVPLFYISNGKISKLKNSGGLKDIAPTILDIMNIPKPKEMTGESLLRSRR